MIELSRHLTATVSHEAFKFLTKPFVLQTSKKLITARHEKVTLWPFFFFWWPLIAHSLLPGQRVILSDFPFHLPEGWSSLKTFLRAVSRANR